MSGSIDKPVSRASGDRVLDFGAVRIHNNHIQSGQTTRTACAVCGQGMEAVFSTPQEVPARDTPDEVVPGDGDDKTGDAPPPPRHGTNPLWPPA